MVLPSPLARHIDSQQHRRHDSFHCCFCYRVVPLGEQSCWLRVPLPHSQALMSLPEKQHRQKCPGLAWHQAKKNLGVAMQQR